MSSSTTNFQCHHHLPPTSTSSLSALRHRVNLLQGFHRSRLRAALDHSSFTPRLARFWVSRPFSDFLPETADPSLKRAAWQHAFESASAVSSSSSSTLEAEERILNLTSPFATRLRHLRTQHHDWPFMASGFNSPALLDLLHDDTDPASADAYWSVTRGVSLLPPECAASRPRTQVDNYASATEHAARVTAELDRLTKRGFVAPWSQICLENGWPPDRAPNAILAIGAVERNGKIRITYDGSAPRGRSVNDAMVPEPTVLPSITYAMSAMSHLGLQWRSDLEDAFLQSALAEHSIPLSAIRWNGKLLAYRRLGFGFKKGPTHQQSLSLAILRGVVRRLRARGLFVGPVAAGDQVPPALPHKTIKRKRHAVTTIPCFLDDFAGFATTRHAAWYSFALFLLTCVSIGLRVSMKPGKTEAPAARMTYLGFEIDSGRMVIFLDDARVNRIRATLQSLVGRPHCRLGELLSLIGTLVFCATVIRLGKTHYRPLINLTVQQKRSYQPRRLIPLSSAAREAILMWDKLLRTLNVRSACTVISRRRVPGEATSDASFSGWGWAGMGSFAYDGWPREWLARIGIWIEHDAIPGSEPGSSAAAPPAPIVHKQKSGRGCVLSPWDPESRNSLTLDHTCTVPGGDQADPPAGDDLTAGRILDDVNRRIFI